MPLNIISNSAVVKQYQGIQAALKGNKSPLSFKSEFTTAAASQQKAISPSKAAPAKLPSPLAAVSPKLADLPDRRVPHAYQQMSSETKQLSGWEQYKEEQLLSNPGGDGYEVRQNRIIPVNKVPTSFLGRIGKDFSDGLANLTNGIKNLFIGVNRSYRDTDGQIQTVQKDGVFQALGKFFKNVGSALTFGQWHPGEENAPKGFVERAKFTLSKLKNAVLGDLVQGGAGGTLQVGEDLVLAGLNLVEIVPDATIGNVDAGRKLTTAIFDNGQVAVDYLTDILPTGEAWLRVHALNIKDRKPPVFYNLSLDVQHDGDARWQTVRNTPFRKTIETVGALLADIATVKLLSNTHGTSQEREKDAG